MEDKHELFLTALEGKEVPILALDNKWYQLFSKDDLTEEFLQLEKELKELLKKQGKLTNQVKDIKKLKSGIMEEIVHVREGLEDSANTGVDKVLQEKKRLLEECNTKLEENQEALLELPRDIQQVNKKLMVYTMSICHEKMQNNNVQIEEIGEWIKNIRIELKKKVIKKQEKEMKNQEIYQYMHNIFGAEVMEIFDVKADLLAKLEEKEERKHK